MKVHSGTWGNSSAGMTLAIQHEDLSLTLRTHMKTRAWWHTLVSPGLGRQDRRLTGFTGQPVWLGKTTRCSRTARNREGRTQNKTKQKTQNEQSCGGKPCQMPSGLHMPVMRTLHPHKHSMLRAIRGHIPGTG